jgi:hypothetical protein
VRLAVLGPLGDDISVLARACHAALGALAAEEVIYLGTDGGIDRVVSAWSSLIGDGEPLVRKARRLRNAEADEIATAVNEERQRRALRVLRAVPGPGVRVVEMIGDRLLLLIDDKKHLDEEDLLPASLILFGGPDRMLRHIGPRTFLCPGPIDSRKPGGVLVIEGDGFRSLRAVLHDVDGRKISDEPLQTGTFAKLRVTAP